jgi:hypothetical protein
VKLLRPLKRDPRLTPAGYPRRANPRWRFRRPNHLQDTVLLQLEVPASMIPWLQACDIFGNGVEYTARSFIVDGISKMRGEMYRRGLWGGRRALAAAEAAVTAFLAEPVNCGPGAAQAAAFRAGLAEIHGGEP